MSKETITLTFGDCAENHKGMQTIGKKLNIGLTTTDLENIKDNINKKVLELENTNSNEFIPNISCELIDLTENFTDDIELKNKLKDIMPSAKILIIRNGIQLFGEKNGELLYQEQCKFNRDKMAFMYGRVVNKKARHNLCFSDFEQSPDYINGRGTIINFANTQILGHIRNNLDRILGCDKFVKLQCEANYYYDIEKTYIGFHGDTERKIVVGLRLANTFPLHFRWFYKSNPIGKLLTFNLHDGDMYIMADKAVGYDWKSRNIYTLRHAAGFEKNL
jgi:hypothetical protein